MTQSNIYFDFNATTPVAAEVVDRLGEWVQWWGNPSSIHHHGRGPKKIMREARRSMAQVLGVHPLEIVFTSGGSESNNLAIQGFLSAIKTRDPKRKKVIIGSIEHPSVLKQIPWIESMGFEVLKIPVNPQGEYDLDFYHSHLNDSVALVSVMYGNNEVGVLSPLKDMVEKAHQVGAFFHSDLVQCLGKKTFSLQELNVDLASFSSHKVYALKGSGFLYVKKGTPLEPILFGGAQERGRRAGTENVLAIASLSFMVEKSQPQVFEETIGPLRDFFESEISSQIEGVEILGAKQPRLANTSCFCVSGVSGESLLMNLDIRGFSVGTGAACSSGNPEPSPVLLAMGLTHEQAQSSLRISMGRSTSKEQVQALVKNLVEVVAHLRALQMEMEEVQGV